jgi:thioredoxin 1
MGANTTETTDATFQADVLDSETPVLVDFWAPWCGPCKAIAPVLDEIGGTHAGKVKIVKINVDENPETARKYQVTGIPLMNLYVKGEVVSSLVGAMPKAKILSQIEPHLS